MSDLRPLWAKYGSFPYWPARYANEAEKLQAAKSRRRIDDVCVYFFGSNNLAWVSKSKVKILDKASLKTYPASKKKDKTFMLGLKMASELLQAQTRQIRLNNNNNFNEENEYETMDGQMGQCLSPSCTHQGEMSVVCEECKGFYHLSCCTPPLPIIPKEMWLCPMCEFRPSYSHRESLIGPMSPNETETSPYRKGRRPGRPPKGRTEEDEFGDIVPRTSLKRGRKSFSADNENILLSAQTDEQSDKRALKLGGRGRPNNTHSSYDDVQNSFMPPPMNRPSPQMITLATVQKQLRALQSIPNLYAGKAEENKVPAIRKMVNRRRQHIEPSMASKLAAASALARVNRQRCCFVCKQPSEGWRGSSDRAGPTGNGHGLKCGVRGCGQIYHSNCVRHTLGKNRAGFNAHTYVCPRHHCAFCNIPEKYVARPCYENIMPAPKPPHTIKLRRAETRQKQKISNLAGSSTSSDSSEVIDQSGNVVLPWWNCSSCPVGFCPAHMPQDPASNVEGQKMCQNCLHPSPQSKLAVMLERAWSKAGNNYLALPFLRPFLPGVAEPSNGTDESPRDLLEVLERIRKLYYKSKEVYARDMESLKERARSACIVLGGEKSVSGGERKESDSEENEQTLEVRKSAKILWESAVTVFGFGQNGLDTSGGIELIETERRAHKGKKWLQNQRITVQWRNECMRTITDDGITKNTLNDEALIAIAPRSIHGWAKYLETAPVLRKCSGEAILRARVRYLDGEEEVHEKLSNRNNFLSPKAKSNNCDDACNNGESEALEMTGLPCNWEGLGQAMKAMQSFPNFLPENDERKCGIEQLLKEEGKALRSMIRRNLRARRLWKEEKEAIERESPGEIEGMVALSKACTYQSLWAANTQLREKISELESELTQMETEEVVLKSEDLLACELDPPNSPKGEAYSSPEKERSPKRLPKSPISSDP